MKNSRRKFLRISTASLATVVLAACGVREQVTPAAPPLSNTAIPPATLAPTAVAKSKNKSKDATAKATAKASKPNGKGKQPTGAPASPNPDLVAEGILGRPTDTSITINIVPAIPMNIFYEYGSTPGVYTMRTETQNAAAGTALETVIEQLTPNTRYYYRLRYNDTIGTEHSFVTGRAPGSTFTFDIQGDSHPERVGKQFDPDLYARTLQNAAADQPDFYITIGDDFSVDSLKTVNAEIVHSVYLNQRQWLGIVGAPVFLGNGNHEQASMANLNGTPNNVAVWAQTSRNTLFPQPAPDTFYTGDTDQVEFIGHLRDYYAFTWGDASFVMIDPYWHSPQTVDNQFGVDREDKKKRDLWNVTLGEAQYRWFKQTLEKSNAKYKFVFSHHVLGTGRGGIERAKGFEWGDSANLAAHRSGWQKPIHQLMADNRVTIFFQGHDHIYARQVLDGVIYQTLPEPADPNYALLNADAYTSGDKFPNSGYLRVTVSPQNVQVEYIRSYLPQDEVSGRKHGEIAHTYTVA